MSLPAPAETPLSASDLNAVETVVASHLLGGPATYELGTEPGDPSERYVRITGVYEQLAVTVDVSSMASDSDDPDATVVDLHATVVSPDGQEIVAFSLTRPQEGPWKLNLYTRPTIARSTQEFDAHLRQIAQVSALSSRLHSALTDLEL